MAKPTTEISGQAGDALAGYGGKAAQEAGMPQLDFATYPNQIFWLLVTLVVIYFILNRLALPRIASVLAERQDTITGDLAMAEELKRKAAEAEEAYNRALAEARAEAQKVVAENKARIQAELDEAIARADAEIAARSAESEAKIAEIRKGAMDAVKEVATATAKEIVAAFGVKADGRTIGRAVSERLKG